MQLQLRKNCCNLVKPLGTTIIMGARGSRMDLKSYSIIVGMPQSMGPRRKAARGKEEMSQSTLRYSKWERESEERES